MATKISPNAQYTNPPAQYPVDNNDYGIGVALGSPGLAPVLNQDPRKVPRTMTTITSPAAVAIGQKQSPPQQARGTGLSRQLSKRLPFLGRSKSRRRNSNSNGNDNNTYSRPSADLGNTNYITTSTPPVPPPSFPLPSRTGESMTHPATRPEATKLKKPMPAGMRSVTDPQMYTSGSTPRQPPAWIPGQAGPVLDVEIPDIKLERYSVMFSNLLEQQQSAGGLLARRQATLARIRAIEDEVRREHYAELQRYRRATSPSITPLQPPIAELPEDAAPGINVVPLRLRSNTFPILVREAEAMPMQQPVLEEGYESPGTSIMSPSSFLSAGRDSEDRPPLHSKFHKPSVESIRSPYLRHGVEKENNTALSPPPGNSRRQHHEGGHAASPSYSTVPKQVDIPSRSTSLHNLDKLPAAPKPHPKPANREEALEEAAEVSIARQISISRQQRRFLEPLHEREKRRARANQHIKAASQISMDGSKRIVETKTGTPTIIHPERQLESPQQHMYRRSERVTIEGA
ncbi:hypothetical protein PWT90_00867 [Aphanocladium album]|nr:hypothetical protein PWT90_00867 [Aphanocladium album]